MVKKACPKGQSWSNKLRHCAPGNKRMKYKNVRYGTYFLVDDVPFLKTDDDVDFKKYAYGDFEQFTTPRATRLTDGVFHGIPPETEVGIIGRKEAIRVVDKRRKRRPGKRRAK